MLCIHNLKRGVYFGSQFWWIQSLSAGSKAETAWKKESCLPHGGQEAEKKREDPGMRIHLAREGSSVAD